MGKRERTIPAKTRRPRTQRQPRCPRQRSRLIFPSARPSPSRRFTRFFLGALDPRACPPDPWRTNPVFSHSCALFFSPCALFRARIVCFQQLAASFAKTPGWGVSLRVSALSASLRYPLPIDFLPLCFHILTNCFSPKPCIFTTIRIARGCHPNARALRRRNY